jgi:cytoskeletal protein CcmA (bactofilin family)
MDVAEIRGSFQGQLTVRKHLVIYATGRVSGEIRYGKIEIEEGGELSGKVSTLASQDAGSAPARTEAPPPAASTAKATPSAPASPSPARPGAAAAR